MLPAARQPSDGALFYLEGGPGGAASDELPEFDQLFGKIAATRDIVFVDQRGTGGSHPLRCPPAAVRVEDIGAVAAYVRRCFARIGPAARQYTTAPAMDDIEAVRRALGYGRIDLFGGSYGATAAQIFLRLHPRVGPLARARRRVAARRARLRALRAECRARARRRARPLRRGSPLRTHLPRTPAPSFTTLLAPRAARRRPPTGGRSRSTPTPSRPPCTRSRWTPTVRR